jgi:hypothetical protein
MIFDEKVLARDFTPEGQSRAMEMEFISTTLELMKDKVRPQALPYRLAYIVMGLHGIFHGIYEIQENAPIPLPANPKSASEVKEMWRGLISPTKRLCQLSAKTYDEKRLKRILMRMCDRLSQSTRNSIFC